MAYQKIFRSIILNCILTTIIIYIFCLSFEENSWGRSIPTLMNQADRQKALEVLGLGTSIKLLSSPAPLGGYSGLEIGLTSESISLEDVRRLGNRDASLDEYNYTNLTLGKGFYYNVDLFLSFTPILQNNSLTSYGGMLRWNFFNADNFPASLSLLAYGGGANFSDAIGISTLGGDLVISVNMEDLSLYFGGGRVRAIGTFLGGAANGTVVSNSTTDSGFTERQDVIESHSLLGLMIRMDRYFVDAQVDRFTQSFYSAKLGMRF